MSHSGTDRKKSYYQAPVTVISRIVLITKIIYPIAENKHLIFDH
jgi:hypothetical protein